VAAGGVAGTLMLAQALGDAGIGGRLWVLTSGAVAAGPGESPDPVQAAVWGLGRVAALEISRRWGGLIDVPAELTSRAAARVRALLAAGGEEDQVAVREAGMLARRLVRAPAAGPGRPRRPSGVVLITGGTGALGGHAARWAAGHGARHVVLASRRGLAAPRTASLAAQVSALGARVTIAACDIAGRAALAGLLARLAAQGQAVTAVIHTAGAGQSTPLPQVTPAEFAAVCAAKAAGAANLDALLGRTELEAFVLYSSVAGVWGSGGQVAYAAANAYLDALAEQRSAKGLTATSVAWGLWGDGGMAAGAEDMLTRQGLRVMAPADAIAALDHAVGDGAATAVVADMDWQRFVPGFTIARPSPLLTGLAEVRQIIEADGAESADAGSEGGRTQLMQRLANTSGAEHDRILLDLVRAQAASVLGHKSAEAVEGWRGFLELGFDSLTAVELRNKLNSITGLKLPSTVVFDFPTPITLAQYVRGMLAESAGPELAGGNRQDAPARKEMAGGLSALFQQAGRDGKYDDFMKLMRSLAEFRPSFESQSELESAVNPIRISRGPAKPSLICFTAFVGKSGAYQYARFAAKLRDVRDVSVLTQPGFLEGERLPVDAESLVKVHAGAVLRCAEGAPFVLVGHSAGGLVAHAVATHLEALGTPPAAVVLIDTFSPDDSEVFKGVESDFSERMLQFSELIGDASWGDSWVTAMARYFSFDWWSLAEISAPTLVVRATEGANGQVTDDDLKVSWKYARTVETLDVPGSHFSMMGEHADSTARAIHDWLTTKFQ
jgi:thioesterase domain-containing protein/NAD(P)-dependent dehydrogenase (short-subunit alcohol dehydrogenase family)